MKAAQKLDDALLSLGFDADFVCWAYDPELEQHVLVLITDFFDHCGPLDISRAIFKAYGLPGFPQEIDPFSIRLHGSSQPAAERLLRAIDGEEDAPTPEDVFVLGEDIVIEGRWLVSRRKHDRTAIELTRRWKRFSNNVDRLAA